MSAKKYDLIIIGSGPAGIHAAVQAAKLGKLVAIVEKMPKVGGAWIHTGTIPSKTLRETLATIQSIKFACGTEWVSRLVKDLSADKLFGRAFDVAGQEETVVREYIKRNRIELIHGKGMLEDEHAVRIVPELTKPYVINGDKIILATGSRPRRPDDIPFDGWRIVDSDEILKLESVPKDLVIYGAGVIGCEYACIFNALGVDVTIVDSRNDIMRMLDRESTIELQSIMEDTGIKFVLGKLLKDVRNEGPQAVSSYADGTVIKSDIFFFAAGRVSTTENIGLERLGVKVGDRGAVAVNEHYQTNIPNIYAVGDLVGAPALAATSAEQGRYASCHAFGQSSREFPKNFPVGIYTIPEMSSAGKTEEEVKAENIPYVVGQAHFSEVARGFIRGDSKGLLKLLISTETHKILGIHIVGPDACNLIHIGLGFMLYDGHVQDIVNKMIFNYPTLAEVYRIAAFNALNKIFTDGIFGEPPSVEKKKKAA